MLSNQHLHMDVEYIFSIFLVLYQCILIHPILWSFRQFFYNISMILFEHLRHTVYCTVNIIKKNCVISIKIFFFEWKVFLTGFHDPVCHWAQSFPPSHAFSVAGLFPAFCKQTESSNGLAELEEFVQNKNIDKIIWKTLLSK